MFKKTALALLLIVGINKQSADACIVTDVAATRIILEMCHTCMFPLTIAQVPILLGPMYDPKPAIRSPICTCLDPFPRIGIQVSFFEPSRIIETVTDPFCFPTLGIPMLPTAGKLGGGKSNDGSGQQNTFMQVHYMIFPAYALMELVTDFICLETSGADYAYLSEVDPMWNSDILAAFIQPEALLFGNPVTNLVCIAESVSSMAFYPIDPLFWCMGSWGNAYPLAGHTNTGDSFIQDTAAITGKAIYSLHRKLVLWGSYGVEGLCGQYPMPIWFKSAYRLQIVNPISHPLAMTIGQTGLMWDFLKKPPMMMDNYGYLLFKKRDCCAL
jgi:conjugal transfer pilus assembly protein TraU